MVNKRKTRKAFVWECFFSCRYTLFNRRSVDNISKGGEEGRYYTIGIADLRAVSTDMKPIAHLKENILLINKVGNLLSYLNSI